MREIESTPGLVDRIPVPPGYEEVEVQRKIRVPNKAAVTVIVKELRKHKGISPVERTFGIDPAFRSDSTVVTVHRSGTRSVIGKMEAKVTIPKLPKVHVIPVKAVGNGRGILPRLKKIARKRAKPNAPYTGPRCSWCGVPVAKSGYIHEHCAEAKLRLQPN